MTDPRLWPTAKLHRQSTQKVIQNAIWETQRMLTDEYDRSGKIGKETPTDWDDAYRIAYNISYEDARRHAGTKVPERKLEKPTKGR